MLRNWRPSLFLKSTVEPPLVGLNEAALRGIRRRTLWSKFKPEHSRRSSRRVSSAFRRTSAARAVVPRTRSSAASTTDRLERLRITKRKIFAPAARSQFLKGTVFGAICSVFASGSDTLCNTCISKGSALYLPSRILSVRSSRHGRRYEMQSNFKKSPPVQVLA